MELSEETVRMLESGEVIDREGIYEILTSAAVETYEVLDKNGKHFAYFSCNGQWYRIEYEICQGAYALRPQRAFKVSKTETGWESL